MTRYIHHLNVFSAGTQGGNPAPIVADAAGMSDAEMHRVAKDAGHESGFVLPAPPGSDCDFEFRFWVPNHEMEMCGHATVGALWLLDQLGRLPGDQIAVWTKSGRIDARIVGRGPEGAHVEITQPQAQLREVSNDTHKAEIVSVLGLTLKELAPHRIQNACTSRLKTLVPLRSPAVLDGLRPDYPRIKQVCAQLGSTGLFPYAPANLKTQTFDARQFPNFSGYPEDAATGIAAAALAFGVLENGLVEATERPIYVQQGRAMGRPSKIVVRFRLDATGHVEGCWVGGKVEMDGRGRTLLPV
jgi:PhzF family phenazine biosynthesis protein